MYIVLVNYVKEEGVIDGLLEAHRAFLEEHYRAGIFQLSGPRAPRTGGVILARAGGREELAALLARDPFAQAGAAEYEILEFQITKAGKALKFLLEG